MATAAALLPSPLLALGEQANAPDRRLELLNKHTGETLRTVYWADGRYVPEALESINHLLRDHRTGEVHVMDPKLLDLMHSLASKVESTPRFQIVSGFRSPQTNENLRRSSNKVAKKSYHLKGKAVDLRMTGVELSQLRRAALSLKQGGVGWYPRSGFIHLDTGPIRSW